MGLAPKPPKRSINSWIRTYQSVWDELALNHDEFPEWFRVWSLAIARMQANGHANFSPGQIARILGKQSSREGWAPKPTTGVSQAISLAKAKGLLDRRSTSTCLVVPAHVWQGGLGSPSKTCPVHG